MTVEITTLQKSYGESQVLHGLTMDARDGEFLTLLGPSGCGKTTTLRCLAGLEMADGGRIAIDGKVVAEPGRRVHVPPNKRDVGVVFQSYALWPHMTVFGNVAYPLRMRGSNRNDRRSRVMSILETVGMERYAERSVGELSGGQQQRVALARAMVSNPKLLLFDEPLSNLDAKLRRSMRREIRLAHDVSGATSVYVTHDQEEAIMLSDRIVVIRDGEIEQVGTPREIYREPGTSFVADFVGFDNLLSAQVTQVDERGSAVRLNGAAEPVWAQPGRGHSVGADAVLAVRAEDLTIHASSHAAPDTEAGVAGAITTRSYTGQHTEYIVDIGPQLIVVRVADDQAHDHELLTPGSAARVRFDPARCVVVEDRGLDPASSSDASSGEQDPSVDELDGQHPQRAAARAADSSGGRESAALCGHGSTSDHGQRPMTPPSHEGRNYG